ncbi:MULTISPECIES: hypothetical protein [unclassified Streptomyces]|uniref:hypothetical protein n=1 Tax=unclassified Streptomyces TaxID=2593676 RepID=UPI002DD7DCC3|nr:hypothetical protein [Streptomyces sp. NBC_01766]WSC24942.1 hypothetical protein OIE60_35350 [Streptomyces sp. NBC_01766]
MNEFWIGTYHGRHDGTQVVLTTTRNDTRTEPYTWTCTCGTSRGFAAAYALDRSAWRHTHPTLLDRLQQRAAR